MTACRRPSRHAGPHYRTPLPRKAVVRALPTVLFAALALTGCGTQEPVDATPGARPSSAPGNGIDGSDTAACGASASPSSSPAEVSPPADGGGTTEPRSAATARPEVPGDAPPNYGDNHAYRNTVELKGEALCRADEEGTRVRGVLEERFGAGSPATETSVREALTGAGYDDAAVETRSAGTDTVAVGVFRSGVCVEARVGADVLSAEAHGVYVEGGCLEPRGGH